MNIDKKKLGKRIKEIRVAEKDTLEAFANKINKYTDGVIKSGKSNVSRWEKGENIPNDITLKAISDIANITVDELLYGKNIDNKIEVGKRIKNIRINLKETTAEFANNFDPPSSNSLVSRWERGVNLPNSERLKVIADLGGISVDELLYSDTDFRNLQKIKEKIVVKFNPR